MNFFFSGNSLLRKLYSFTTDGATDRRIILAHP